MYGHKFVTVATAPVSGNMKMAGCCAFVAILTRKAQLMSEGTPNLRIISLGAGVQSTTLLLMAVEGQIEKPDCAIFADTGWEPQAVYDHLNWLDTVSEAAGIPMYRVTAGNLRDDALQNGTKRSASIPLYVRNQDGDDGKLRRQCTQEYKVAPIQRKIRDLVGGTVRGTKTELWMGISLDEVQRMKPSRVKYIRHRWPLIEHRMTRSDCLQWLERHGYHRPPRSSCIGCPFHDNRYWRQLKNESPHEWQDAVAFDQAIRRMSRINGDAYLHRSLVPLSHVDLSTPEDHGQMTMFDAECTGYCGV